MTGIEIVVFTAFTVWAGRVWWDRRRNKNRTARNAVAILFLIPVSISAIVAPPAILHFGVTTGEIFTRAAEMADIVVADECNLFQDKESLGGAKYRVFAGDFFGPGIVAFFSSPTESSEKELTIFSNFTTRRLLEDNFTGNLVGADGISVYTDGEKVATKQTFYRGIGAVYEGAEAVSVMKKIADARQARIVLTQGDETAEVEFSEGDICRFRKLRDLWHEEISASQESRRVL